MAKKKNNKKRESAKKNSNLKVKNAALAVEASDEAAAAARNTAKIITLTKEQNEAIAQSLGADASSPGVFGAFGSTIKFLVNDPYNDNDSRTIRIPKQIQRETRSRWTSYNLIGQKPKKEFIGPEAAQVTLNITLSADQGVNPRETLEAIKSAIDQGTVDYLVIGGKVVGDCQYYIESMSETWERFFQGGKVIKATGDIIFSEYN